MWDYYAGLFETISNGGTVQNVSVSGAVSGTYCVGGIAGDNYGTILACINNGTVSGKYYVGGIVGNNHGGTVQACINNGTVSCVEDLVGGITGLNKDAAVTNCYNTGVVTGSGNAGGITGANFSAVTNCYNTGSVTCTKFSAGGIAGRNNGTVTNCYNAGTVYGEGYADSIVGFNKGTITGCDTLTAEQLKDAGNFHNWDFFTVWYMGEDAPQLRALQLFAVAYVDASGERKEKFGGGYTELKDQTELSDGWYAVTENTTIDSRITVNGNVDLILCDGAELTVPNGINVPGGKSLTIYGQIDGTGKLIITSPESHYAALGGGYGDGTGSITINGGVLDVKATYDAAGIGGGYGGSAGNITINGGDITAQGGGLSAAIGSGGGYGAGGTVTINGGKINAIGGTGGVGGAAGIGASHHSGKTAPGKTITLNINGGEITAKGGNFAAGIGGGSNRYCEVAINITGGTIDATGGIQGVGIGGGRAGTGGIINISGGSITAAGGSYNGGSGAGIGGGSTGAGGVINITGGTITATPGSESDTQAIGHGSGATDSGTLNLGSDDIRFKVGTVSGNDITYVGASQRIGTAQSHTTVRTEPCTNHNYNEEGLCSWCGEQTTAYPVTFVDEDGKTVLQQSNYMVGLTPSYKGKTPTKKGDATYFYTFSGWTPKIKAVTGKETYQAVYTPAEYPLGDVTMDGAVDISDVTKIQRYIAEFGTLSEKQKTLGDVNRDGEVDIHDATLIQRYLAEFIESF